MEKVQEGQQPQRQKTQQEMQIEWSLNIIDQHMQSAPLSRHQHNEGKAAYESLIKHLNVLLSAQKELKKVKEKLSNAESSLKAMQAPIKAD